MKNDLIIFPRSYKPRDDGAVTSTVSRAEGVTLTKEILDGAIKAMLELRQREELRKVLDAAREPGYSLLCSLKSFEMFYEIIPDDLRSKLVGHKHLREDELIAYHPGA